MIWHAWFRLRCWVGLPPKMRVYTVPSAGLVELLWLRDRRRGVPLSQKETA